MASTGTSPALPATLPFTPGQGEYPLVSVQYSTDDASDTDPLWIDASDKVRSFSTARGRNSELDQIDAGTATIVLDNRDRIFDPIANPAIRPLNRWRIREQFSGATELIFVGYAESVDQQYPYTGADQIAIVTCADDFMLLALDNLPVTNPPRDTYADVVLFDKPSGYWRMDEPTADAGAAATVGKSLSLTGTASLETPAAIVGDPGTHMELAAAAALFTTVGIGESGDPTGLGEFTVELWFRFPSNPGANRDIILGPQANSLSTYSIKLLTTGAVQAEARNSAGTNATTASGVLAVDTWHHIVASITGPSTFTLYINGAAASSTSFTGSFHGTLGASDNFTINSTAAAEAYDFDEVAVYRYGLPAARVAAHYEAGTERGFPATPVGSSAGDKRVEAILTAVESNLTVETAGVPSRPIVAAFMHGQSPLDEIRRVQEAERPDGIVYISRDGLLVLLGANHRSLSPWDTVQATFDDDGTDLPYTDVDIDYSSAWLFNDWNLASTLGELQHVSDSMSIGKYFKRSQSITNIPLVSDVDVATVGNLLLAKYKDPMTRIRSISLLTNDPDLAEAVFQLDIGDRIRIFRTHPAGGTRIDQTSFVQSINVEAGARSPVWSVVLGVSPL